MILREKIINIMHKVAKLNELELVDDLNDETVLLQCGLDSLGFAVLVACLEEELNFDPFTMTDEPIYPRTLGEFISFYEKMAKNI